MSYISKIFYSVIIFYSINMTASQALDLTTQLKISFNLFIVQDAETVDQRQWTSSHLHDLIRRKLQVRRVGHGEYKSLHLL